MTPINVLIGTDLVVASATVEFLRVGMGASVPNFSHFWNARRHYLFTAPNNEKNDN